MFGWLQVQPKAAALARSGLHADPATQAFDGPAHNSQPGPGAVIVLVEAMEELEDTLVRLRRDADAVVLKPEADNARGGG